MSTTKKANTKVITSVCTLSYPHLDKPQPLTSKEVSEGKTPKFSGTFVFTPEHLATPEGKATMQELQTAAILAATEKFGNQFVHPETGAQLTAVDALREGILRTPFRKDGVTKGYAPGSIFINARSAQAPGCVYPYKEQGSDKPAKIPTDKIREVLYAGSQVRASVVAFTYAVNGNKGVSFALNNVQFIADGKRLDNKTSAEDEFEAVLDQAPADLSSLIG